MTDWKDVAGIASMIGLPPAVLQRATQRFSALLGEDMEPLMNLEDPSLQFMEGILEWTSTRNDLTSLEHDESRPRLKLTSRAAFIEKSAISSPTKRPGSALLSRKDSAKKDQPLFCPFKDRKSTRLNSSHSGESRMPSSA